MDIRYCKHCKKATPQYKECDTNAAERIFFGVWTLGWSETIVKHWWRCAECGRVNNLHDFWDKPSQN